MFHNTEISQADNVVSLVLGGMPHNWIAGRDFATPYSPDRWLRDFGRSSQVFDVVLHGDRGRFGVAGFERFQHFFVPER